LQFIENQNDGCRLGKIIFKAVKKLSGKIHKLFLSKDIFVVKQRYSMIEKFCSADGGWLKTSG